MGKFTFDEAAALETGASAGGKKVLDTGVYDVTIKTASIATASTGTEGIDWSLQVDGAKYPNMVYGFWIFKANGDKIFNFSTLQGLMGVLGVKELTEFTKDIEVQGGTKKVQAYKELDGKRCKVAIAKVYDVYNNAVTEKNEIKAFFSEDGKTFAEQTKNSEAKQILWYQDKMKDTETKAYKAYKADAPDEEEDTSAGSLL